MPSVRAAEGVASWRDEPGTAPTEDEATILPFTRGRDGRDERLVDEKERLLIEATGRCLVHEAEGLREMIAVQRAGSAMCCGEEHDEEAAYTMSLCRLCALSLVMKWRKADKKTSGVRRKERKAREGVRRRAE